MKQGTLFEINDEQAKLEEERIQQLSSDINKIKLTYELSKDRFEKYESKYSINTLLKHIKDNADPMGLLLSSKTLFKFK